MTEKDIYNHPVNKPVGDELGYTGDGGTKVEQQHGMSRDYRPPYILSPVVEQRLAPLKKGGGLTQIYNPIVNYQHTRWTRYNLLDAFTERVGKEFSRETFNLFIDGHIQSENKDKLYYALEVRPNKEQTLSNFLQEFAEHAYRNRKNTLYINRDKNIIVNLPPDLSDEHGNFVKDGVTSQFQEEFYLNYGIKFDKKYYHYSKYTQAGRAHINYPYFWIDLIGLLNAQHPRGILHGRGRVSPTAHLDDDRNGRNSQEYQRLNNFNRQLDETSTAFVGTDETYTELFTNRVSNAEQYLTNQLNMLSLSGGFDDKILTGSWETEAEYQNFYRSHILPLVEYFCQTLTSGLFSDKEYLAGNKVTQNVLRTTPYDIGLIGQSTLVYDGRLNPNEIRSKLGLSTDNAVLDKPLGNLNMAPLNEAYFEASETQNALNVLKAKTSMELIKKSPELALESQRRTSVATQGMVQDDGSIKAIDPTAQPAPKEPADNKTAIPSNKQKAFKKLQKYKKERKK